MLTAHTTGPDVSLPMSRIRRHLDSWGTGTALADSRWGCATVLLEDPAHLPALLASELTDPDGVIFVPGRTGGDDPRVVGYEGSPTEPGSELAIGDDFFLQLQDYAAGAFTSLLGPTLVTVTGVEDFGLFLADADRALVDGVFPEFLTAAPVRLAGACALGAGRGADGPRSRLYVNGDGDVSTTPTGRPLGPLGTGLAELDREWRRHNTRSAVPCSVCLAGVLDDGERGPELAARPWLGRYLAALDALRTLGANGLTELRVSGFGPRLLSGLDDAGIGRDRVTASAPLLLWCDDAGYVHQPGTGRTFRLERPAAELAETLLACGSIEAAAAHTDRTGLRRVASFFATAGISLVD